MEDVVHDMELGCRVTGKTFDRSSIEELEASAGPTYLNRKMHLGDGDVNSKRLKTHNPLKNVHILLEELSNEHVDPMAASADTLNVEFTNI